MRFIYFLIILLFYSFQSSQLIALEVKNARIGHSNGTTRFVLELSKVSDFNSFILKAPDRAVIDLPNLTWKGNDQLPAKGLITNFRQGYFNANTTRFVLDLKAPAKIAKAFMLKPNGVQPARFVLDLVPAKKEEILQKEEKQVGNLTQKQQKIIESFLSNPNFNLEDKAKTSTPSPQINPAFSSKTPTPSPYKKQNKKNNKQKIIVLDPGHGGIDPGAIGKNGLYEKHVTLSVAKLFKKELEKKGYKVVMTRNRDIFVRLRDRIQIARKAKGDLFISLHADSAKNPKAKGFSIYTLSDTASDRESELLAQRENKADIIAGIDLTDEPDEVASILINLTQRDTMNQSKQFANLFVRTLRPRFQLRNTPHKSAGFRVLKGPDIPAVLIELGFLSNPKEAKQLKSTSHRQKIARELAKTVQEYFTWQKNYATI